jgi:hypothetical protein
VTLRQGVWSASINLDRGSAKPVRMLLNLEEVAAKRQSKVDSYDGFPVLEAAMDLTYEIEKIGHLVLSVADDLAIGRRKSGFISRPIGELELPETDRCRWEGA